ncbi:MAG: ABC transporter ATP-binding protein [Pseudomonadota bacterium]
MTGSLLEVTDLAAGYDGTPALFGVSLTVGAGEAVALIGRNGMGKTTTVKAIMGMIAPDAGTVKFAAADLAGKASFHAAQAGIGLVPEGRQIFPSLTVEENLLAMAADRRTVLTPWTLERVYALFPRLSERQHHGGNALSGGEQQMLAIGRALMTNPRLLILDEATEGLAPLIRADIWRVLTELRATGLSILVIDKALDALRQLADRFVVLEKGSVAWTGAPDAFCDDPALVDRYLSV